MFSGNYILLKHSHQPREISIRYYKQTEMPSKEDISLFSDLGNILRVSLTPYPNLQTLALCEINNSVVSISDFQPHVNAGEMEVRLQNNFPKSSFKISFWAKLILGGLFPISFWQFTKESEFPSALWKFGYTFETSSLTRKERVGLWKFCYS